MLRKEISWVSLRDRHHKSFRRSVRNERKNIMTPSKSLILLFLAALASVTVGFSPRLTARRPAMKLEAVSKAQLERKIASATAAVMTVGIPLIVRAVEDDYEYGAVDAPIGLAVGAGVLAILTAAIPVLLAPGEEALEEMRKNEGNRFGTGESLLNKKKK
jgi:hypothetical protein